MFIATEYRGELADPNGREEEQHKKREDLCPLFVKMACVTFSFQFYELAPARFADPLPCLKYRQASPILVGDYIQVFNIPKVR